MPMSSPLLATDRDSGGCAERAATHRARGDEDDLLSTLATACYVGGEWIPAANGATIPVDDPATGDREAENFVVTRVQYAF